MRINPDNDNIILDDNEAADYKEFVDIHHPEPKKAKPKAVPVKKIAATGPRDATGTATNPRGANGNQRKSFDRADNEGNIIKAPQDRSANPARKSGYRDELSAYAGKNSSDSRATRAARHAKPGGIVHGDYPNTSDAAKSSSGKHGKPWNGRD